MAESARLKLPLLAAAQAQKHVTHNEALTALDTLVQLSVIDKDLATPPMSPSEGDCYIVAASPTGEWSGWATRIARFSDGIWRSFIPREGWLAYVEDEGTVSIFDGAVWASLDVAGYLPLGGGIITGNLGVGGATPDATNRLAVASPAILFNRETDDIQVKLNKQAAGDDAAFIFQANFSTRALIGLLGDDNFTFKVSPDGSAFHTGFVLDRTNGNAAFSGLLSLLGGQLAFPATQNASADPNTLDDYEEGTWTPVLATSGTQPTGVTYGGGTGGNYVKVGPIVTAFFQMALSSKGSGATGNWRLGGLPFTVASLGSSRAGASIGSFSAITFSSGFTQLSLLPTTSTTYMRAFENGSGAVNAEQPWANLSNTSFVVGVAQYLT